MEKRENKKQLVCQIFLTRHGHTTSNRDMIMDGHFNAPLTDDGVEHIKLVAKKFKSRTIHKIYSSDLIRAVHTAELLKPSAELEIEKLEILRERFYDTYEGKTVEEFLAAVSLKYPNYTDLSDEQNWFLKLTERMENYDDVFKRYDKTLRELGSKHLGENIIVIGHGTAIRSFLIKALNYDYKAFLPGSFGNGKSAVIEFDGQDFKLISIE